MKICFLLSSFLTSIALWAQQSDLVIPAGTQKVLTPAERTLSLRKFTLEDNVTIVIPPSMNGWTVTATDVSIGNNVKIVGQVADGANGSSGSTPLNAPGCRPGISANSGIAGQYGIPGKNISLNLKIRRIGTLTIQVNGSKGGNGGNGGNGGKGGNATCACNAGPGGRGGNGGNGGQGGTGGAVSIVYYKIGHASVNNSNFIIQNMGGINGIGGAGGAGGAGGEGSEEGACPDGKATIRPAGVQGPNGTRGVDGTPGRNGTVTITAQ